MKYALLIYDKPGSHEALGEQEREAVYGEYFALSDDPRCVGGAQLQPTQNATTVQVENGRPRTTAGPAADTSEVLGGYYVFEAENTDQAIELAARIPSARLGGKVEVRPLVER